ncbi:hypothetical protein QRD02_06985 [Aequorivita sp. SDUM287046]|uniref:Uncharacterized protein n=1 Tax=Aequorivita aurantiaca TaxID=3053356 RepID=A0ABT8DFJ9_9FLAO|nr:hypothetical protein [Aequorivita aurantiaca]MDN3724121.1 hypothetical protein [Aequorivita aurantiaca]
MKNIIHVVFLFLIVSIYAQESEVKNTFSLHWGTSYLARQDLIFSPLYHTDFTLLNVGIEYTRNAKMFQKISFRYGNFDPIVSSPYDYTEAGETETTTPHSFIFIDVDYQLGKNIKESSKNSLTIGGLFAIDVQSLNYEYGRTSSFGYYSTLNLGVFGKYKYTINSKSNLSTTLQLPLIAWLARSPYLVNDDEFIENTSSHSGIKTFFSFIGDGEFATWNKLQTFNFDLKYTYSLNEKWSIGAAYLFEFLHSSEPRNLLSYRQTLNIGTNFNF